MRVRGRYAFIVALLCLCASLVPCAAWDWSNLRPTYIYKRLFPWKFCNFVDDPAASVERELRSYIYGQDAAVERIVSAIRKWEDDSKGDNPMPLTIILTGATGAGKSETANRILSGLLPKGYYGKQHDGYLHLYGDDFQDASNTEMLRRRLNNVIAQKLYDCSGDLIIIFDELQMAHKPVLRALLPLMQGSHSQLKHPSLDRPLDASRIIMILISDIGIPSMEAYVNALSGSHLQMSYRKWQSLLEHEMREQVQNEFIHGGFPLGSLVDNVIAFLPFNATGARDLLMGKVHMSATTSPLVKSKVDAIEITQEAAELLVLPAYLKYSGKTSCIDELRKLQNAPPISFADEIHVDATGTLQAPLHNDINTLHSFQICGRKCTMPASCMVSSGGRGVIQHAESPYMRIANRLNQIMPILPDKETIAMELRVAKRPPVSIKMRITLECPPAPDENSCIFHGTRLLYHHCVYPKSGRLDVENHCSLVSAIPV